MILSVITSRFAGPILGAALAVSLVWGVPAHLRNAKLQRTAEAALNARDLAEANLSICQANTASLDAARAAQNEALRAAKEAGEAKAAELAKALQAARKAALAATSRAERLEAFRPEATEACAAMLEVDEQVRA